ncbi:MAG TPA: DUF4198 domain-containing protein [Terriglobales bacterium]|nr:DUF4198 domain-containing protein [Terriglobales bacterium]
MICAAVLGLLTANGVAHDLWLVAEKRGGEKRVCARIGEHFPASMNAVTADRVERFQVKAGGGVRPLEGTKRGKQFCAPGGPEAGVAEMIVAPRYIRLAAKDFNGYIEGEGFKDVIRARAESGKSASEGRELYSRYAKLLVGAAGTAASEALGHALEIVPEKDPATLAKDEPLAVRVLFLGKPLGGVRVSAMYAGAVVKGHEFPVTAETDTNGRAQLKLDRPGLWYARLIHMVEAQGDPEIDWRSFFATLTFEVPK